MEAKIRRIVNEVVEGLLSTPDTTFPGSLGNKRLTLYSIRIREKYKPF